MSNGLKRIECDPKCGFAIQSHDEKEIVKVAADHVRNAHHMKVSTADIKSKVKTV